MSDNFFPNISTTVQSITTSVALVTPQINLGYQPLNMNGQTPYTNAVNPPALLFHYEGENVAHVQSDSTDHFIENNSAIQDQISLKPEQVQVHGFIGELNDIFPVSLPNNGQISAVFPPVAAFVSQFTVAGQDTINQAAAAYRTEQSAQTTATSAWGALSGGNSSTVIGSSGIGDRGGSQGLQQIMFQQFYQYWRTRTLFRVQTPWAVFTNMVIMELRATQDESTRMITEFYVSFKMLRFATTSEVTVQQEAVDRAAQQRRLIDIIGASPGEATTYTVQDLDESLVLNKAGQ